MSSKFYKVTPTVRGQEMLWIETPQGNTLVCYSQSGSKINIMYTTTFIVPFVVENIGTKKSLEEVTAEFAKPIIIAIVNQSTELLKLVKNPHNANHNQRPSHNKILTKTNPITTIPLHRR